MSGEISSLLDGSTDRLVWNRQCPPKKRKRTFVFDQQCLKGLVKINVSLSMMRESMRLWWAVASFWSVMCFCCCYAVVMLILPIKYITLKLKQVVASPWSVMRVLGENCGYNLPSMPMIGILNLNFNLVKQPEEIFGHFCGWNISFSGRVQSAAGERNTCIYTLQKKYTWPGYCVIHCNCTGFGLRRGSFRSDGPSPLKAGLSTQKYKYNLKEVIVENLIFWTDS